MKRLIFLLLSICILLGLCACNTGENTQTKTSALQAGFGRENITPYSPVGMAGYQDDETRKSDGVLDYVYTTCVAFKEGDETILVYTVDACGLSDSAMEDIREQVTSQTQVPNENIFIGATHTHSAPGYGNDQNWDTSFLNACADAAKAAIADLAPVQMQTATATLENMNFVRHYLMNDGTYYGSNFGSKTSGFKAHAIEYPDRQLILLKLDRETKKDILMVNWQAHPASAAHQDGYNSVSADFVGHTRTQLENETDMMVAYYTGASGNTNAKSEIVSENIKNNSNYCEYGKRLAQEIMAVLPNLTTVEATGIQTSRVAFAAPIDHSWDHLLQQANEVYDLWQSAGKNEGDALGMTYGFTSVYQARAIRTRAALPETEAREMRAFRVGPIGFTTGTYEMYSDHAVYVKENSPFDITFIITGCSGYIGNKASFEYRSYETDTGMFACGTGESMAEEYVKLLNAVKE